MIERISSGKKRRMGRKSKGSLNNREGYFLYASLGLQGLRRRKEKSCPSPILPFSCESFIDLIYLFYIVLVMLKSIGLDYSRVEIAVAARPQPMKL
jgi:hypothetical protein